jgi:hypothetical protein
MIYHPDTSDFPGGEEQFLKDYRPSAGRMFKIGMGAGFDDTLPGLLTSLSEMDQAENQPLLTKEDWEASKFYDPEIKWDDSFTTPKARLLKERRDRERELGFLLDRAGMGATASFYAGALVGTVPDPVNYLPFVGIASKAKSAAVLGKIAKSGRLGRGATTAADAVIGTAVLQSLVFKERDTYQLKYDTRDALTELGLALGLGFGFGAILGKVHPKDPDPEELLRLYREREGSIISLNKDGEPIFTPKKDLPPEPTNTRAQQDWDSVAPTDKVEAVRRKIANDAVGTQDNVPIVRQQGAQQAIAQEAARLNLEEATPEFRQWFSGSKVTSKSGTPMRMYHGSPSGEIEMFGQRNFGLFGEGYYFTNNPDVASTYAKKGSPTVYPVYLSIKNPMNMDQAVAYKRWRRMFENDPELLANVLPAKKPAHIKTNEDAFKDIIDWYARDNKPDYEVGELLMVGFEKEGIDGLTHKGGGRVKKGSTEHRVFIAFEPEQIKFAYDPDVKDFAAIDAQTAKILQEVVNDVDDFDIPDSTWNTPRPAPEPLPAPDDTPISANEARLQQMEAALDERIRTAEANGTLSETDARELAYIDEEIVELDKYHQAVSETIECVIANG